jgi:Folded gastrulation N-terminus
MKQITAIIAFFTIFLTHGTTHPVTSKALENNADQLIWQTAWYSQHIKDSVQNSPYSGGDKKKITAKSIFITPNLHNQETSLCPPGYKIDEKGKCLKTFNFDPQSPLHGEFQISTGLLLLSLNP